jgi:hypothetical protein
MSMDTPSGKKDFWEKSDILLKGVAAPLAVALVGYLGTSYLSEKQREETQTQFYASLLAKREEADSNLRKEMFRYVIETILGNPKEDVQKRVVGLEMVALNFHDSFDLSPLFRQAVREIRTELDDKVAADELFDRLVDVCREIVNRQVPSLTDVEHRWDAEISDFRETRDPNFGSKLLLRTELKPLGKEMRPPVHLTLELLGVDAGKKAVHLRVQVYGVGATTPLVERVFWLTPFDFPALNSVRLPHRERVAVALLRFEANSAQLQVLHFPEMRASLKEKPLIDDLVEDLRRRNSRGSTAGDTHAASR